MSSSLGIIEEDEEATSFGADPKPVAMTKASPAPQPAAAALSSKPKPKRKTPSTKSFPSSSSGGKKLKSNHAPSPAGRKKAAKSGVTMSIAPVFAAASLDRNEKNIMCIDESMPEYLWRFDLSTHIESIDQGLEGKHNYYLVGNRDSHLVLLHQLDIKGPDIDDTSMMMEDQAEMSSDDIDTACTVPFFTVHAVDEKFKDPEFVFVDQTEKISVNEIEITKRRIGASSTKAQYSWKQVPHHSLIIKILQHNVRRSKRSIQNMDDIDKQFACSAAVWFPEKFNVNTNLFHGFDLAIPATEDASEDNIHLDLSAFKYCRNKMLKAIVAGRKATDASWGEGLDGKDQLRQVWNEILFNAADTDTWINGLLQPVFVDSIMDLFEDELKALPDARKKVEAEANRTLEAYHPTMLDLIEQSDMYEKMTVHTKHYKIYPENEELRAKVLVDAEDLKHINDNVGKAAEIYPPIAPRAKRTLFGKETEERNDGGGKPKAV